MASSRGKASTGGLMGRFTKVSSLMGTSKDPACTGIVMDDCGVGNSWVAVGQGSPRGTQMGGMPFIVKSKGVEGTCMRRSGSMQQNATTLDR